MVIDSHSHIYFPQFDNDRDAVLGRMREKHIHTIAVGTSYLTSSQAVALAKGASDVVRGATIGLHPNHAAEGFDAALYTEMLGEKHRDGARIVLGVGECGLDYFRGALGEERERQRKLFEVQIRFALAHDLPLMLHVRPSKGSDDAHDDALALLGQYHRLHGERLRGTAHFFTGSLQSAQRYWGIGFCTSFPGVVTFAPECEEVLRAVPPERILVETDAPYAAPASHRGERNEPVYVEEVVRAIAHIRGVSQEEVAAQCNKNTQHLFNIG